MYWGCRENILFKRNSRGKGPEGALGVEAEDFQRTERRPGMQGRREWGQGCLREADRGWGPQHLTGHGECCDL